ncbi:MAG: hypothetical protein GC160_03955 [Acidobacteria bacterium]|nr:hypothetical protein [Acidobacteriota bacterium]
MTILAIGSHYDDIVFGIPGVLLQAIDQGHRVVILALLGDYTNWPPVDGRAQKLVEDTRALAEEVGAEMRFLHYASMHLRFEQAAIQAAAEVVVEVAPETAFLLWPDDSHPDHEAASRIAKVALHGANRLIGADKWRPPRRMYQFDNGPGHTIGFEPNVYVDVSEQWDRAAAWLGKTMAAMRGVRYDPSKPDAAIDTKRILAEYRGKACGARYAEALRSVRNYPQKLFS